MNSLSKGSMVVLMLLLSGHLTAQSTQLDSRAQQIYLATDSLHSDKIIVAKPTTYNRLKISPFSLLLGQLSLFYERALTNRTSLVIGYGTGGNRANFGRQVEPGGAIYQRVTLEGRRYWVTNRSIHLYVGPYLRLSRLTMSGFIYDQQGNALKDPQGLRLTRQDQALIWIPGLMVGGQWIKKWFCIDGSLGLQRQVVVGSPASSNQLVEAMTAPWAPRLGLSVGVAF